MSILDDLERLEKATTAGPWYSNKTDPMPYEVCSGSKQTPDLVIAVVPEYGLNADFIAATRNALPQLLAVVKAARELVEAAEDADARWDDDSDSYAEGIFGHKSGARGWLRTSAEEARTALAALEATP